LDILLRCPKKLLDIVDICPIGYPIGCPNAQLDKWSNTGFLADE